MKQPKWGWCGIATQLLNIYTLLFNEYNEKKISAQKYILIKVSDDGISKLRKAQISLQASSQSFNNVSG
ncbi:hemolysin E [Escherichia coli]|nr:hemolysin E [Escherichia coli]